MNAVTKWSMANEQAMNHILYRARTELTEPAQKPSITRPNRCVVFDLANGLQALYSS